MNHAVLRKDIWMHVRSGALPFMLYLVVSVSGAFGAEGKGKGQQTEVMLK